MRKAGFEKQAEAATHQLEAGQGRRNCEQDVIGGTGTDGDSQSESRVGKKAM